MRRCVFLSGTTATGAALGLLPATALAAGSIVNVAYAGSLVTMMERAIGPAFESKGYEFRGVGKGSIALANELRDGVRHADVFVSADTKAIEPLMTVPNPLVTWYATFASSRMVIGYASNSPFAAAFVDVARGRRKLTEVLLTPGLRFGRTDPSLDPKGYRSIQAARLLEAQSGVHDFARKFLGDDRNPDQIFPEETLSTRVEIGELDAGFFYATEASARHIPAVELPAGTNLADRIIYALTIPENAPNRAGARAFVEFLLGDGRATLTSFGLRIVPPVIAGDRARVPAGLFSGVG